MTRSVTIPASVMRRSRLAVVIALGEAGFRFIGQRLAPEWSADRDPVTGDVTFRQDVVFADYLPRAGRPT